MEKSTTLRLTIAFAALALSGSLSKARVLCAKVDDDASEITLAVMDDSSLYTSSTQLLVCAAQLPVLWKGQSFSQAGEFTLEVAGKNGKPEQHILKLSVTQAQTWFPDVDGDGFGNGNAPHSFCEVPQGYVLNGSDCNDSDPSVYQATEYFVDSDGDGFGSEYAIYLCSSDAPDGYSLFNTDCDDQNASVFPGSSKTCRGIANELNTPSATVFPNIGSGRYTISLNQVSGTTRYQLFTTQGQLVWEKTTDEPTAQELNIENHSTGVYFLTCSASGFSQNVRIVKQ